MQWHDLVLLGHGITLVLHKPHRDDQHTPENTLLSRSRSRSGSSEAPQWLGRCVGCLQMGRSEEGSSSDVEVKSIVASCGVVVML